MKGLLTAKDIAEMNGCTLNMAYRYIEVINEWLRQSGRPTLGNGTYTRKLIRKVDYEDFVGGAK